MMRRLVQLFVLMACFSVGLMGCQRQEVEDPVDIELEIPGEGSDNEGSEG